MIMRDESCFNYAAARVCRVRLSLHILVSILQAPIRERQPRYGVGGNASMPFSSDCVSGCVLREGPNQQSTPAMQFYDARTGWALSTPTWLPQMLAASWPPTHTS